MLTASDQQAYEQAAVFRDQMQALRRIQEKQFVDSGRALDADVIACVTGEDEHAVAINLVMIRSGRHLGDKTFFRRTYTRTPSVPFWKPLSASIT